MKEGRFVQSGTPQEIVTAPKEDYVYEFTRDVDRSRVLTFGDIKQPATGIAPSAVSNATLPAMRHSFHFGSPALRASQTM